MKYKLIDTLKAGSAGKKVSELNSKAPNTVKYLNYIVLALSLLCWIGPFYRVFALISEEFVSGVPHVWNVVTSGFFEINPIYLAVHLVMMNVFMMKMEGIWTTRYFLYLCVFTTGVSGLMMLGYRAIALFITGNLNYYTGGSASLSYIIIAILMGLRQNHYDSEFDTRIPVGDSTFKLSYNIIPQVYVLVSMLVSLIFEVGFDARLFFSFISSWVYLRFFMKNELTQTLGDTSGSFSFAAFFPERFQPKINSFLEKPFKLVLASKLMSKAKYDEYMEGRTNDLAKKKALKELDDELEKMLKNEYQSVKTGEEDEEVEIIEEQS